MRSGPSATRAERRVHLPGVLDALHGCVEPIAVELVRSELQSPHWRRRRAALRLAVEVARRAPALLPVAELEAFAADDPGDDASALQDRGEALHALAYLPESPGHPITVANWQSEVPGRRVVSVAALVASGDPEDRARAEALLHDAHPWVRGVAERALARAGSQVTEGPDPAELDAAEATWLYGWDPERARHAQQTLLAHAPDRVAHHARAAATYLVEGAGSPLIDRLRESLCLAESFAGWTPALLDRTVAALRSPEPAVRVVVAGRVPRCAPVPGPVYAALLECLDERWTAVRDAAQAALVDILGREGALEDDIT